MLQEASGATSSRRCIAFCSAIVSNVCLVIASWRGMMSGVYAGIVAGLICLVLLGYTTVEDVLTGIRAVGGMRRHRPPDQPQDSIGGT